MVRWPGHIGSPGTTSPALVSQTDLLASFANLFGVPLPSDAAGDGVNVMDALLGKTQTGRKELVEHQWNRKCALRQGQWKFINGELYDLENDLAEEHNLAKKMPEKAKVMEERLGELNGNRSSDPVHSPK
jgi:arylsulfatase A-like enzyme